MKIVRLAGLVCVATVAVSLVAASAASAEAHFRWQDIGTHFIGLSGLALLRSGPTGFPRVHCKKDLALGIIASLDLVGSLFVHFLECKSQATEGGAICEASSVGATSGLILVLGLHAVLGLILPRSGSGVGLLVLPGVGKQFVELEKNACTPVTKVTGNVAGEVTPVGQAVTLGNVTFATGANNTQNIKEIDVLGKKIEPELVAFGETSTEETQEVVHWLTAVEVT